MNPTPQEPENLTRPFRGADRSVTGTSRQRERDEAPPRHTRRHPSCRALRTLRAESRRAAGIKTGESIRADRAVWRGSDGRDGNAGSVGQPRHAARPGHGEKGAPGGGETGRARNAQTNPESCQTIRRKWLKQGMIRPVTRGPRTKDHLRVRARSGQRASGRVPGRFCPGLQARDQSGTGAAYGRTHFGCTDRSSAGPSRQGQCAATLRRHTCWNVSCRVFRTRRATEQPVAGVKTGASLRTDRAVWRRPEDPDGNPGGVGRHRPPAHPGQGGEGTHVGGETGGAGNAQTNPEFGRTSRRKCLRQEMIRRAIRAVLPCDHLAPRSAPGRPASGRIPGRPSVGDLGRDCPGHTAAEYERSHFGGTRGGKSARESERTEESASSRDAVRAAPSRPTCDGTTVLSRYGRRLVKVEIPWNRPKLPGRPGIGIGRLDSTRPAFAPPTPARVLRPSVARVDDQRRRETTRHEPTEPAP
jgi:hypothetical protein